MENVSGWVFPWQRIAEAANLRGNHDRNSNSLLFVQNEHVTLVFLPAEPGFACAKMILAQAKTPLARVNSPFARVSEPVAQAMHRLTQARAPLARAGISSTQAGSSPAQAWGQLA